MSESTTEHEPRIVQPTGLEPAWIDPDAFRSVRILQERGHEAYLVGGCVRDLLCGRMPKDFDIATSARPQLVKRIFPRNCRIIGRRFKLAHLHFHRNSKILEVSTFRRTPDEQNEGDDLLITQDNEFGTAEEDAVRRDFTMNALFYDPVEDSILDYVGGLEDVRSRVLQTIGDPDVRFREDPVRILRAAKFMGRLSFTIESATYAAMKKTAPDLSRSAPPRLLEEILRLLRSGHAYTSFLLLRDVGALEVLLPVVADYLERADSERRIAFWRMLDLLDAIVERRGCSTPPSGVLLGVLFALPVLDALEQETERSANDVVEDLLTPFTIDLRLPRRDSGCLKRVCGIQPRLLGRTRRVKPATLARTPFFSEAVMLHGMLTAAIGEDGSHAGLGVDRWRGLAVTDPDEDAEQVAGLTFVPPARTIDWLATSTTNGHTASAPEARESTTDHQPPQQADDGPRGRDRRDRDRDRDRDGRDRRPERGKRKSSRDKKRVQDAPKPRKQKKDRDRRGKDQAAPFAKKSKSKAKKSRRDREAEKVEELEPEAIDTSFFDLELSAKRPPSFGTPVEGTTKKKRRVPSSLEDDDYKPPLPPGDADSPPPPTPGTGSGPGGEFGDW